MTEKGVNALKRAEPFLHNIFDGNMPLNARVNALKRAEPFLPYLLQPQYLCGITRPFLQIFI